MRRVPTAPHTTRARPRSPSGRLRSTALPLILVLLGAPAAAEEVSLVGPAVRALERGVRVHRLANGMTFLLLERHQAPIFSGVIRFRVGGMDERPGESGLAHLFEHLAFKGTTRIGGRNPEQEAEILAAVEEQVARLREAESRPQPDAEAIRQAKQRLADLRQEHRKVVVEGEFLELYASNGAVGLNASTDKDLTSYYVSLPADRLELWCLMESERLRDGVLREFYTELEVVMEERRMRVETQPLGSLYEALLGAAFGDSAYGIPTVGRMEDLKRLRTAQALEFRRQHYRPQNAVAALAGDFKTDEAVRLIERYFGDWRGEGPAPPAGAGGAAEAPKAAAGAAPQSRPGAVGAGSGPRRVEIEFPSQPYLLLGFGKPVHPHADAVTFEVLDTLLSAGRSSLLYKTLVSERQIAVEVFTFEAPGQRQDNLLVVGAVPRAPHGAAEVEAAIVEIMEGLGRRPPAETSLQKVRNQVQAGFLRNLNSNSGLAQQLSYFQILLGDWQELLRLLERIEKVDGAAVQAAARRYLGGQRRVTAELVPRPPAQGAPAADAAPESGGDS